MPYKDSSTSGGRVRIKASLTAGERIGAAGLRVGELALNAADGKLFYKTNAGGVGEIPCLAAVSCATYAEMLALPTYSAPAICVVAQDENKNATSTTYLLWPDGSRLWVAALQE